jgi:hypothetical protein
VVPSPAATHILRNSRSELPSSTHRRSSKTDYVTRLNEAFEPKKDGYHPTSNPYGSRPEHRTPQGAEAARKRLSLGDSTTPAGVQNGSNEAIKANLRLPTPSDTQATPANKDDTTSVKVALNDAGIVLSSVGKVLGDLTPPRPARLGPAGEADDWNLSAANPIFAAENSPRRAAATNDAAQTPKKGHEAASSDGKSPASNRTTPRSAGSRSLPGSAAKSVAEGFPRSFQLGDTRSKTSEAEAEAGLAPKALDGGLAGWMRRHEQLQKALGPDPLAAQGGVEEVMVPKQAPTKIDAEPRPGQKQQREIEGQKQTQKARKQRRWTLWCFGVLFAFAAIAAVGLLTPASTFAALRITQQSSAIPALLPRSKPAITAPKVPSDAPTPPPSHVTTSKTAAKGTAERPVPGTVAKPTPAPADAVPSPRVKTETSVNPAMPVQMPVAAVPVPKPAPTPVAAPIKAPAPVETQKVQKTNSEHSPVFDETQGSQSDRLGSPGWLHIAKEKLETIEAPTYAMEIVQRYVVGNPTHMAIAVAAGLSIFAAIVGMAMRGSKALVATLPCGKPRTGAAPTSTPAVGGMATPRDLSVSRSRSRPRSQSKASGAKLASASLEDRGRSVSRPRSGGKSTGKKGTGSARGKASGLQSRANHRRLVSEVEEVSPRGRSTTRRWRRSSGGIPADE